MQTIDIHSHFFPESWPDFAARFGTPDWPWLKHFGNGEGMVMVGDREFRPSDNPAGTWRSRIEELDQHGVDLQIISATPVLFAYQRPAEHALTVAQVFNDAGAGIVQPWQWPAESALPGTVAGHRCLLRRADALHEGRARRRADRQSRRAEESRRSRHHHLSASLRGRRRCRAGASLGHDGPGAHAEVHDALDGRHAGRDATRNRQLSCSAAPSIACPSR